MVIYLVYLRGSISLAQGIEQGIEQGIRGLVDILREMGTPREIIIDKIMEKFELTKAQAEKFVQ